MDTLAHTEKYLSLHFLCVPATLLICFRMYCLISWESLSDRATHKDLNLNSHYGFFTGMKKRNLFNLSIHV